MSYIGYYGCLALQAGYSVAKGMRDDRLVPHNLNGHGLIVKH